CQKRDLAEELKDDKQISTARACRIIGLERSGYYYQSIKDDTPVERRLLYYAEKLPTRGCPEYTKRIRKEGYGWNHKRIERIYRKLGLNKRRRKIKRRIPNPEKEHLLQPVAPNITWSMDFMSDVLENGRKIRILNVIDDYNREALMCEIDYSFPSEKVVRLVERLIDWHGKPSSIRTDNGTEFIAKAFEGFCSNSSIRHIKIQKGKPMQNGFCERFNKTFREDVLDAYWFENIEQARTIAQDWMKDYNHHHPHSSLADCSPIEFKLKRSA
ncbi:MAG: IS3 family transposase, partial [Moheibacter sp.]